MSNYVPIGRRRAIEERAQAHCEYCLCPARYAIHTFECEHIIPISKNGTSDLDNLAWACAGCNKFKASRLEAIDPQTDQFAPLYNPRNDKWTDHFAWSDTYTQIIGMTATGRATITALRLNRTGVVNVRTLLFSTGQHPPDLGLF